MKKGTKVGIGIGCGLLLLVGVAVLVAGYYGLNYIENNLGKSVEKLDTEGRELGKTTDKKGCMDQAMRRSASVGLLDIPGSVALTAFVDACFETSGPTANFCEGVPSFWSMKENEWSSAECTRFGVDPEKTGCVHVMKRKHEFCNKK